MPDDLATPARPMMMITGSFHRYTPSDALVDELGYRDVVPAAEGIADTARWLAANPPSPGGSIERRLMDPFDYAAEDALLEAWDRAVAAVAPASLPGRPADHRPLLTALRGDARRSARRASVQRADRVERTDPRVVVAEHRRQHLLVVEPEDRRAALQDARRRVEVDARPSTVTVPWCGCSTATRWPRCRSCGSATHSGECWTRWAGTPRPMSVASASAGGRRPGRPDPAAHPLRLGRGSGLRIDGRGPSSSG